MPKRVGKLIPRIASLENLHEAFLRAARGKTAKRAVIDFRRELDENLIEMGRQLTNGTFRFGQYHFFTIYDPKQRTICAASFPERVAFHAMMRICHPVFDGYQIGDSYASRIDKGTYKALERTQQFASRYQWFAKLDICKYFDSINHQVLLHQLSRLFKDVQLLIYFRDLLDSYETEAGKGLPIGNLTSQYFANHYLSVADHYAKEQIGVPAMVRYMDDVLLFANKKDALLSYVRQYTRFVTENLHLQLHAPVVNHCKFGIPYLGYVVYGNRIRLNQRSRRRFCEKMIMLNDELNNGMISEREYATRASCLYAFVWKADVADFCYKYQLSNAFEGALTA